MPGEAAVGIGLVEIEFDLLESPFAQVLLLDLDLLDLDPERIETGAALLQFVLDMGEFFSLCFELGVQFGNVGVEIIHVSRKIRAFRRHPFGPFLEPCDLFLDLARMGHKSLLVPFELTQAAP